MPWLPYGAGCPCRLALPRHACPSQETARILGLDPEEKDVIDSYYPNPILELVYSMRDCIIDEINGICAESTDLVLKFAETSDNLDVLIWSLLSACRFPKELIGGSSKKVCLPRWQSPNSPAARLSRTATPRPPPSPSPQ